MSNLGRKPRLTPRQPTPQQARLIGEYLKSLDATQAARAADYSPRHAASIGCNLLKLPHVAAAIKMAMDARAKRTEVSQDRVLKEIARVAFSDVRAIFDETGQPRSATDLDDDTAAAVASIEVVERPGVGGGTSTEYVYKIKLVEKAPALALLCRHLGMLKDKVELTARRATEYETAPDAVLFRRVEELLKVRAERDVHENRKGLALDAAK